MPLQKEMLPLNIAQPANQKVDPQTLNPGTPTLVKNAKFIKANRIDKRYGHTALTMTDTDDTTITDCKEIIGTETNLLMRAGDKVYDYLETDDEWREIGVHIPCETTIRSVTESQEPLWNGESVYLSGLIYYAYSVEREKEGQAHQLFICVMDAATNQIVSGPTQVLIDSDDSNFARLEFKLILFNGVPILIYDPSALDQIYGRRLGPSFTDYMDSEVELCDDAIENADQTYFTNRLAVLNWSDTRLVIAYRDLNTAGTVNIRYFDNTLTELTGAYALRQLASMDSDEFIQLIESSSGTKFFVVTSDTVNSPSVHSEYDYAIIDEDGSLDTGVTSITINVDDYTSAFGTVFGCTYIMGIPEAYGGKDGIRLHLVMRCSAASYYSGDDCAVQMHIAEDGTETEHYVTAGSYVDEFLPQWDLTPVTREITYNSRVYQVWHRAVQNDSCYFLVTFIDNRPYVVCQFLWGRTLDSAALYPARRADRNLNTISSGIFEFAALSKDSASEVPGLVSVRFDFTSSELFTGIPYGKSTLIAGTNLHTFDGNYVRELGFFHRPKAPTLSQGAFGSAAIADGTYSVVFVFEYTDRNGLLHRSAPSDATSITVSSGSGQASISCIISTYTITNLKYIENITGSAVKIVPYRTTDGGSIYYREANFPNRGFAANIADPEDLNNYNRSDGGQVKTIVLALSDANLSTQPILYTDSGEITAAPIPPVKYLAQWNDRIIAAGTARDERVYYSKLNQTNLIPEFTETLSIGIQGLPGSTTGVIGFSDKLILSKRGRLYYSYGDGPDNTGQGGDFALFEQIIGVSGAVNGKSMALNSEGLYYKADKGVYLLDSSLSSQHIGAMYEDEADTTILKTISPITSETIRLLTSAGIIEHDTFFKTWSLQDGDITPVDAAIYNNSFYCLSSDDVVYVEDRSLFKDGSNSYAMLIETGWIALNSILGFQRLYKLFIKATYKSVHTLKVSIAYDYSSAYLDEVTIDPADAIDNDVYRFTIFARIQKCQAFRLKFEEVITDGTAGTHESLQVNFIGVVIGRKQGSPKLKDAQKVGFSAI